MTNITFAQVRDEVIRLINENPDYVYPHYTVGGIYTVCYYTANDDHEACVFGRALANLNFDSVSAYEGKNIAAVLREAGIPTTAIDKDWVRIIQMAQDNGHSWGEALRMADNFDFYAATANKRISVSQ